MRILSGTLPSPPYSCSLKRWARLSCVERRLAPRMSSDSYFVAPSLALWPLSTIRQTENHAVPNWRHSFNAKVLRFGHSPEHGFHQFFSAHGPAFRMPEIHGKDMNSLVALTHCSAIVLSFSPRLSNFATINRCRKGKVICHATATKTPSEVCIPTSSASFAAWVSPVAML